MVHYPIIYLYYGWVNDNSLAFSQSLPGAAGVVAGSAALARVFLKPYDEPVRRRLTERWLKRGRD
jgi:peptidoglycan/LPS O-acetylase OafA/YrhL